MALTFVNFTTDITCDCLSSAVIDNESIFGLKLNGETLTEKDLRTYWEKGKINQSNNCDEICSKKGLSASIILDYENFIEVVRIYRKLFSFAPKYKTTILYLQLPLDSSMVKHTPNDGNPYHYDIYKGDDFKIEPSHIIGTVRLLGEVFGENV